MRIKTLLILGGILISSSIAASQVIPPEFVAKSAKYARLKAMQRAMTSQYDEDVELPEVIIRNAGDSEGCDLNIGNVFIDEDAEEVPDEVIVIIEGDFLQSNNCR